MPYITIESGALSDTQKEELTRQLTRTASDIIKTAGFLCDHHKGST